ncbi:MAG TPA: MATE family efflux transporter [Methylomirabilota bacterium]|nr:MATE family efflux transporter [Methylomirabilota bacterium]
MSTADAVQVRHVLAEASATLLLGWPMILSNLAQAALTGTDVLMMGWLGPEALAAGALGANLYFAVMMFGIGLMIATTPMVARELGRNRHAVRDVRRTVRQGFWLAAAACGPMWLTLWFAEPIFLAMGQDPTLSVEAGSYVRPLMLGLFPVFLFIVLRSFVSAMERPNWALAIGLAAVPLNAMANWILMFGKFGVPPLGLVGAGIGSSLTALFMFAGLSAVIVTDRRFRRYRLFGRFWRSDWPRFRELCRLGLPIGVMLAFEVTVFNAAAFLMGLIGVSSLAAYSIAIQIATFTFMVPLGLSQAATVRVGLAYGRGDQRAVRLSGWTSFGMAVGFMSVMAATLLAIPETLIGAFLDRTDPVNAEPFALAVTFVAMAALFQVFDGAQSVAGGMLRGLHDTRVPMIHAAIGYWGVGMVLAVVLAFPVGLEGIGIWIGLLAGLAVVSVLLIGRWLRMTAPRRLSDHMAAA